MPIDARGGKYYFLVSEERAEELLEEFARPAAHLSLGELDALEVWFHLLCVERAKKDEEGKP